VTTQIKGRKGDDLLTAKTGSARFPTIMILDSTGDPLLTITRAAASVWGRAGRRTRAGDYFALTLSSTCGSPSLGRRTLAIV